MEKIKPSIKPFPKWLTSPYDWAALGICVVVFFGWALLLTTKYFYFGYYDWDLAMYAQVMWGLLQGDLFPSIFGINFLANHAEYFSFLLIPIYFLFPHPLTLVYLKIFSWVGGGFLLFCIGKNRIKPVFALIFMILYLFFPANIYAMLYEFHFESLAIGMIFLLYYFFREQKFVPFCITMFLTCLIKENLPPVIAAFGIFALFFQKKNKWRWSLIPLVVGAGTFYLFMFIITPALRVDLGSSNAYLGMYQNVGSTPLDIGKTLLFNPLKILKIIFQPENLIYLDELFRSLLFLPVFSPHILFLGSPLFLQHLLSSTPLEHTIFYHYAATLTPFIFLAAIESLRFIQNTIKLSLCFLLIALMMISSTLNLSLYRGDIKKKIARFQDPFDPIREQMIQKIPQNVGVTATLSFLTPLSQRQYIYSFMNTVQNRNGLTWEPFELPLTVSYALVDFEDGWIREEIFLRVKDPTVPLSRIQNFVNNDWAVKDAVNDIVLFQKSNAPVDNKLIERSSVPFLKPEGSAQILIDQNFFFDHCEINRMKIRGKEILPLTFYWEAKNDINKNYLMVIQLKQKNQTIFSHARRIGYTIFPTMSWRQGDYIKEHYWMLLPKLTPGEYSMEINFYAKENKNTVLIQADQHDSSPKNTLKIGNLFIHYEK